MGMVLLNPKSTIYKTFPYNSRICLHFSKISINYSKTARKPIALMWTNPSILRFVFPWILWKGQDDSNSVFLTFDDGPHPEYTRSVLDILKMERIKAAFFLNGNKVLLYPGLVERMTIEGHTIGSHGFSHIKLDCKRTNRIRSEIERTDAAIERITGRKPIFFRPPYGRFDLRFKKMMQETGHRLALWSLLAGDFLDITPEALIERIWERLHSGAIIVLHDGHPNAPMMIKALPELIRKLQSGMVTLQPLDILEKKTV
jgi:peptidoglycan/xylan/chitin deacetylase (PgdA/CDA1 family)